MHEDLRGKILSLILDGERYAASEILAEYAETHSFENTVTEILEPVMARFGELWSMGNEISLGQGYVAGKVAEDLVEQAAANQEFENTKGPIVIGNIEDDSHSLGRKLVVVFLRLHGWDVIDLGVDVPAEDFVQTALEAKAPIIAASAMMYHTALNIKRLRDLMDEQGLNGNTQLAVGGAIFLQRPDLVNQVGGDGTSPNAIKAPQLFDELLAKAIKTRGSTNE